MCVARVTERGRARDGVCAPIPPLHSEAAAAEECFCRSERQTERGGRERKPEERAAQAQAGEGGGGTVALVVSFAARLLPPPALEKPVCCLRLSKWFINVEEGNNSTVSLTPKVYSVLTS